MFTRFRKLDSLQKLDTVFWGSKSLYSAQVFAFASTQGSSCTEKFTVTALT